MHAAQMHEVDRTFGDVRGSSIADIGCGTGRASMHLAKRGAQVTGFDFSASAIAAANHEARGQGLTIDFAQRDVFGPVPADLQGKFDGALTIGCLAIACDTAERLAQAIDHVSKLVKPGGKVLFLEPIHRSRLLRRILPMNVGEWILRCEERGLELRERGNLFFVPARYLLAFRDLPAAMCNPVFDLGERVLHASKAFDRLSDYKVLLFQKK
jgi:2-polyprenyl-3-methyl-5-hydroxy-6-metoxy-1,4-benzoquinol methylase